MARNSEKAQSMLFRFRAQQASELGILDIGRARRPKNITEQTSIPNCEKWRGQVLKEISRKIERISLPTISDYQIRDINDEINKLHKEKHVWEIQIRNLGGPSYFKGSRSYDDSGKEIPGSNKGYRYYGRARELPGVKELFEAAKPKVSEKPLETRADLRKLVDASYYGYNLDEEDGTLLAYEAAKEKEAFENLASKGDQDKDGEWEPLPGDAGDGQGWALPTLDQIQEEMVDRRRRKLLDKLG